MCRWRCTAGSIRVLRAANQLPEDTPLPEVESQTRTYYQKAFAENTHTAYLLWDGETLAGTGAVSYFQVMPTVHNPTGRKAYLMNLYTEIGRASCRERV